MRDDAEEWKLLHFAAVLHQVLLRPFTEGIWNKYMILEFKTFGSDVLVFISLFALWTCILMLVASLMSFLFAFYTYSCV